MEFFTKPTKDEEVDNSQTVVFIYGSRCCGLFISMFSMHILNKETHLFALQIKHRIVHFWTTLPL